MWVTQSYLATVEPEAKVFIYYLFEDYNPKQKDFTEQVQFEMEKLGKLHNNNVALLMPNPSSTDKIEHEMRQIRPLWELIHGTLPALLISTKPMKLLDSTIEDCYYIPFKDQTPSAVAKTIKEVRQLTYETLDSIFEEEKERKKSFWDKNLGEGALLKLGLNSYKIDLKKLLPSKQIHNSTFERNNNNLRMDIMEMNTREYNILFNRMNIKTSEKGNLITGPKFFKIINEFDPAHEDYNQYIEERRKRGLSTSRKTFCKEVLDNLENNIRDSVVRRINQIADEFENITNHEISPTQVSDKYDNPWVTTLKTQEIKTIPPENIEIENSVVDETVIETIIDEVPPRVFISYAWGDKEHQDWVLKLSDDLRKNGVDTILDKYELRGGKNLTHFMENSLEVADKVLIILTKEYKDKALGRTKGAGVEYSLITSEISENIADNVKYIPILRGQKSESTPMFLKQYTSIYMKDNGTYHEQLKEVLHSIFEKPIIQKSEIGIRPAYLR